MILQKKHCIVTVFIVHLVITLTDGIKKMSKMSTVQARENFSDLINTVAYGKTPVTLTRRGKPLVAVVPLDILKRIELDTLEFESA